MLEVRNGVDDLLASPSSRRPEGVSVIPDEDRSNSVTPNCSSSALMWPESAGWLRCSVSAARVRWPNCATVTKERN